MSVNSDDSSPDNPNVYEDINEDSFTLDLALNNLLQIPVITNKRLRILYLKENKISTIPEDFFPSLPDLMWLDLRDNEISAIPRNIEEHGSLTHLLIQNNKITELPNELGTVPHLKVLQLSGNPLTYPPKEVINEGIKGILPFLLEKYFDGLYKNSSKFKEFEDSGSIYTNCNTDIRSYNSVLEANKASGEPLAVSLKEKDLNSSDDEDEYYAKSKGKCPKLAMSRYATLPPHAQSFKYSWKSRPAGKVEQTEKIKRGYLKDVAMKKHMDSLASRERILQGRKNIEAMKNWRGKYRQLQYLNKNHKYDRNCPFDTSPEYMTLLSREDIEKDLPDKYRKRLIRKCKPSVPRKSSNDVHLAMKIKQLFENLDAIDLTRGAMTPRTEQKVLLGEIQKITEIKQKLMELSSNNTQTPLE